MLLFLIFIAFFSGTLAACNVKDPLRSTACVSKTQFVLSYQALTDPPISCPEGQVCTEGPELCSSDKTRAVCLNAVQGSSSPCNECDPNKQDPMLVCVNQTAYGVCINGKLSTIVMSCTSEQPYCKIKDKVSSCTTSPNLLDCPASGSGSGSGSGDGSGSDSSSGNGDGSSGVSGSGSGEGSNVCTTAGFFPDTTDPTCLKYYKCQRNFRGSLDKINFQCLTFGTAFNPSTKRCVPKETFKCPNV